MRWPGSVTIRQVPISSGNSILPSGGVHSARLAMCPAWLQSCLAYRSPLGVATRASDLRSVTMSQIAQTAGVGRATLYKYFLDVESILTAWHGRQITSHLEYLAEVRDRAGDAAGRLEAVLEAYALPAAVRRLVTVTMDGLRSAG